MIINFRQGIVSYPSSNGVQQFLVPTGNFVSLSTTNGVVEVAIAHRTANYLHTESVSVPNAWGPFTGSPIVWLYWDIDNLTGARTFGHTDLEPIAQAAKPVNVDVDQHWFDTSTGSMKVWTGSRWQEKIRVFAAEYDADKHTFMSVSVNSNLQRFEGTQVGIQNQKVNVGRIIVDNTGMPITNQSGLFFTTEDDFFINGSPINTIRLEANILTAQPVENIAGYQVVKFVDFGEVQLAGYNDLQNTAIAIAVQDTLRGDVGSFVVQGVVTNPEWNWTAVGTQLWVLEGGVLVDYDPHTRDNVTYGTGKAPVGRVIGPKSIIFDQGLGGKGDKGDSALADNGIGDVATQFELGKVKLTYPPADPGSPYVVETSDPRMRDARQPLPHTHTAADIFPVGYGTSINGDLQTTLQNFENTKLNKTGDTMTGALVLAGDPTETMQAATKHYVDQFIPLSQRGAASGVATLDATGKITASQLPQMSITDTFVVNSEAEMLLAQAQTGDLAVRTDIHTTFILKGTNPTVLADWQELLTTPDGVVWIDVTPNSEGLRTTGGPVTSSGTIKIELADDIAAIEALTGVGVAHRTGNNSWEVKAVDLAAGGNVVTGVLPMANGGTGLSSVNGYIKGNGTLYSASTTIPGSDIVGMVPAAATVAWSGVTSTPTTLAGYGINNAYTKTETNNLTWDWSAINNKPSTLVGYGITDVYSKTEVTTFLAGKADKSTTLAGYGIVDAALATHNHALDGLSNVSTSSKVIGDILSWSGTQWVPLTLSNAVIPTILSGKTLDDTNTITVKDANFTVEDDVDTSRKFKFQASTIATGTTRVYNAPNSDGTLALTNGFGATGNWNINAATATNVAWSGVTATPTTLAGYGITDAYTKSNVDSLTWDWGAITGTPTTLLGYGILDAYTKTQTNNLTWNWSAILNTPTTLLGYGITNAYTKAETGSLTWNWSAILNTPTTLAGYGITDAAGINHNHDGVYLKPSDIGETVAGLDYTGKVPMAQLPANVSTSTYTVDSEAQMVALAAHKGDIALRIDLSRTYVLVNDDPTIADNWLSILTPVGNAGTITYVGLIEPAAGIKVTGSPVTSSGNFTLALANDLAAVEALSSTGYAMRMGTDSWATSETIPMSDVTGTLPITQGGTGATTAAQAITNLGAAPLNGVGATGTWNINISGNAASATVVDNGVYTTGSYSDPVWIQSLSADKVVGSWPGSTNVNTLSDTVTFGDITQTRNKRYVVSTPVATLVDSYNVDLFEGGKYLIHASCTAGSIITEVYVTTTPTGLSVSQTGAGDEIITVAASYNGATNSVEITVTPTTADTVIRMNATLFAS